MTRVTTVKQPYFVTSARIAVALLVAQLDIRRAEKRKEHVVVRISQLYMDTRVLSVDPPKKTIPGKG